MLSVKSGSVEETIISFVADFLNFRLEKTPANTKIFTQLPTISLNEKDHVAGLASILRFGFFMPSKQYLLLCMHVLRVSKVKFDLNRSPVSCIS